VDAVLKGRGVRALKERSRVGRPSDLTSSAIVDAAREVFAQFGYRKASLDAVAAKLGITRQGIYHYFPSKHRILLTILVGYFDLLDDTLSSAAQGLSDPSERFETMLRTYFRVVAERPADAVIMTREFALLPGPEQRRIRERRRRVQDAFVREFEAAQSDGRFRAGRASVLVSLLLGAANWTPRWFRSDGRLTPEELGNFAQDFLAPAYHRKKGER
jgi:AcrR family transcriptional regulator